MAQWVKAFPIKVHNPNPLNPQLEEKTPTTCPLTTHML